MMQRKSKKINQLEIFKIGRTSLEKIRHKNILCI